MIELNLNKRAHQTLHDKPITMNPFIRFDNYCVTSAFLIKQPENNLNLSLK